MLLDTGSMNTVMNIPIYKTHHGKQTFRYCTRIINDTTVSPELGLLTLTEL